MVRVSWAWVVAFCSLPTQRRYYWVVWIERIRFSIAYSIDIFIPDKMTTGLSILWNEHLRWQATSSVDGIWWYDQRLPDGFTRYYLMVFPSVLKRNITLLLTHIMRNIRWRTGYGMTCQSWCAVGPSAIDLGTPMIASLPPFNVPAIEPDAKIDGKLNEFNRINSPVKSSSGLVTKKERDSMREREVQDMRLQLENNVYRADRIFE